MNLKCNLIFAAALMLAAAPLAVSAKPEAKDAGKNKDVGVFGAEFGANEKQQGGDKGKAGAKDGDKPGAKGNDGDKPGAKGKEGDKPGAKDGDKGKPAAGKPAAKDPNKVVFDPPPPVPDEAAVAKARKMKKPSYMKFAEAKDMAWKCQQPLIVAMLPAGSPESQIIESKALKDKYFAKEFVMPNCLLLIWRVKPGKVEMPPPEQRRRGGPPPKATTIDTRPFKQQEVKFLSAFVVSDQAKAMAQHNNGPDPKYSEMRHYPTIFCVDPSCSKLLFRAPRFEGDKGKAGFGAWMSQIVDLMQGKGIEPQLTPMLKKICEDPFEPKKWK